LARRVETDMSVFLSLCRGPVLAVTGSKGKSSTASALHYGLLKTFPGSRLGGNITTSPLSFLADLAPGDPVVLELSSWQLGDLRGRGLLKPRIAILTTILPDHLDRYGSMEPYVADKKLIYENQNASDYTLCFYDDPWGRAFAEETPGTPLMFSRSPLPYGLGGAWLEDGQGFIKLQTSPAQAAGGAHDDPVLILPRDVRVIGEHQKINLLAAGLALYLFGISPGEAQKRLAEFPGIEHRLELCGEKAGVRFYNDSAATIPEALSAAVKSFPGIRVNLITGGKDKKLDFSVFAKTSRIPKAIYLLQGSATVKLQALLDGLSVPYNGPYASLDEALGAAVAGAKPGEAVLFSPGCTSFGMFLNEFDRGRKFKALVSALSS
jgi:UDP-N-acetylmuramoylalanine--D-glutamate ligase